MSVMQKLTLIGMYNYDDTIFDQISFPEGVDRDLFVNSLLLEKGEQPVLYASITFNKSAFGVWSLKWYHSIERLLKAFTEDYNPLHNFDRNEDYSDTEARTNTNTENGSDETTGSSNVNRTGNSDTNETSSDNTENTVSAYNSDMYQPDTNTAASGSSNSGTDYSEHTGTTDSQKVTSTRTGSANENRSLTHKAHLYGNIGVTKSQEMLLDELDLRSKHNLYDAIIEIFANEFLISIY